MEQILLDGGLDLVRARPATEVGRLQDCLNYEVGYRRGYGRIDGWERFDGSVSPSSTTGWVMEVLKTAAPVAFTPPERLLWVDPINNTIGAGGALVATEDLGDRWRLFIVFRTGRTRPTYGDVLIGDDSSASFVLTESSITGVKTFPQFYTTHQEYQDALASFAEILRQEVKPVPGTGTIVGLHFHEDALYAVRDALTVTVQSAATVLERGMYVYNAANQIGQIVAIKDNNRISIAAVDEDGFIVAAGDTLSIATSARFEQGSGDWFKLDEVSTTGGYLAALGHITLRDGAFESGNAVGEVAFINPVAGNLGSGDTVNNNSRVGSLSVASIIQNASNSDITISAVATKSEEASLWRSTDDGWVPAPVGGLVNFTNAETEILADDYTAGVDERFPKDTDIVGSGPSAQTWNNRSNLLADDGNVADVAFSNPNSYEIGTVQLRVDDFRFQLNNNDEVTGFEVEFEGQELDAIETPYMSVWLQENTGNPRKFETDDFPPAAGFVTRVAGTPTSDWSNEYTGNPPPSELRKSSFGFIFELRVEGGQATNFEVDYVKVRAHYRTPVGDRLYLWNGSTDVGFIQRSSLPTLTEGAWDPTTTGDAGGSGFIRVTDWTPYDIPSGLDIRTEAGGLGARVGRTVSNGLAIPTLPGSQLLEENRSRYQMISYNFYANEDRNAIYGCSGAGPAFAYDGRVLEFISTGLPIEQEKPRHLAPHEFRLALGYSWGEVYVSEPGKPTEFDPLEFATTFGFGDKITGLMPAAGNALAVFTESTTNILTGAAGDEQNPPQQRVINHKIGAIEYTVQSIGNRPIFASFRGIETLETMDEFSDFYTAPLTYDVSPWLLERLQTAAGLEATDKSVVNSVVVRNKNQYRLFFSDGFLLTLTLVGTEREPQNTIQRYWFSSEWRRFARVFATASGVTADGRDRSFFSVEERPATPEEPVATQSVATGGEGEVDYVYELDRGRSFDGGSIIARATVSQNFGSDEQGQPAPMATARDNVFHLHGEAHAYAALRIARSSNYEFLDDPVLPYELVEMGSLTHAPEEKFNSKFAKGRLSARGFALTFHVEHESSVEFPHVLQLITLLDNDPVRLNR